MNRQWIYANNQWPNPAVLKIENVSYKAPAEMKDLKSDVDGAK